MDLATILGLANSISEQVSKKYNGVGIKTISFLDPNIFIFTLNDGLDTIVNIPISNFNNFSSIEKTKLASLDETVLSKLTYNGTLLFDGEPISSTTNGGYYNYQVAGVGGVLQYTIGYISNTDTIMTASSNNMTHCGRIVGFIIETKAVGEQVKVQNQGELVNPNWDLISGDSYYLGLGGEITNIVPTSGFVQKVGIAKNLTTLLIDLGQPIKLI